jgi:hypothetical protein
MWALEAVLAKDLALVWAWELALVLGMVQVPGWGTD